jgi:hypothetical protein
VLRETGAKARSSRHRSGASRQRRGTAREASGRMENRRYVAVPRALVWAALVVFTLYIGLRLAAGPGRDFEFASVKWTGAAIAETLVLTAILAALFARAAYMTYRTEIAPPAAGTLVISGARMGIIADAFLAIVGGLLMLLAVFMVLHMPEMILVGNVEQYRNYASVSVGPNVGIGVVFGGAGFALMILRRYVWVFEPGKPIRRYWARAFSRGRVVQGFELYWTFWYTRQGAGPVVTRVPVAHWLRARDPSSAGFFRDCDLQLAAYVSPEEQERIKRSVRGATDATVAGLTSTPEELRAIEQAWQVKLAQVSGKVPHVAAETA